MRELCETSACATAGCAALCQEALTVGKQERPREQFAHVQGSIETATFQLPPCGSLRNIACPVDAASSSSTISPEWSMKPSWPSPPSVNQMARATRTILSGSGDPDPAACSWRCPACSALSPLRRKLTRCLAPEAATSGPVALARARRPLRCRLHVMGTRSQPRRGPCFQAHFLSRGEVALAAQGVGFTVKKSPRLCRCPATASAEKPPSLDENRNKFSQVTVDDTPGIDASLQARD